MAGEIKRIDANTFVHLGERKAPYVGHSLGELPAVMAQLEASRTRKIRRFLEGMGVLTIVHPDGSTEAELPETAEGMVLRLNLA